MKNPPPQNLTATWLRARIEVHGNTKTQAVRNLNARTGRAYTLSRINDWLAERREPDRNARIIMLHDALRYHFDGLVGDPSYWADMAEALA